MLKLQVERDPRTGVKVLSCYLLPQLSAHPQSGSLHQLYIHFFLMLFVVVQRNISRGGGRPGWPCFENMRCFRSCVNRMQISGDVESGECRYV